MNESFCCAYWDWLKGVRAFEPVAHEFGLEQHDGEVLKRQCDAEWKRIKP